MTPNPHHMCNSEPRAPLIALRHDHAPGSAITRVVTREPARL